MNRILELFNWKENPANVFLVAGPLALVGFGATLLGAVLRYYTEHDPVYLGIWVGGVVLLLLGLAPVCRLHRTLAKLLRRP